jgi:predicted XRE-type DNA-binding protein
MTKKNKAGELATALKITKSRALEAVIKAQLIAAIAKAAKKKELTHEILAERSGLPRSAVTGILSGSMQKVTINRILRLVEAAELVAEIKVRNAA